MLELQRRERLVSSPRRFPDADVLSRWTLQPRACGARVVVVILEEYDGPGVVVALETPTPDGGWIVVKELRLAQGEINALAKALRATRGGRAHLYPPEPPPHPLADLVGELVN